MPVRRPSKQDRKPGPALVHHLDATHEALRRARAVSRVLQSASCSPQGVEKEEVVEVADLLVELIDKASHGTHELAMAHGLVGRQSP